MLRGCLNHVTIITIYLSPWLPVHHCTKAIQQNKQGVRIHLQVIAVKFRNRMTNECNININTQTHTPITNSKKITLDICNAIMHQLHHLYACGTKFLWISEVCYWFLPRSSVPHLNQRSLPNRFETRLWSLN